MGRRRRRPPNPATAGYFQFRVRVTEPDVPGGPLHGRAGGREARGKNANHDDGMLAMCGVMDGFQATIDHASDIRVLFDVFYPGTLPGDLLHVPAGLDFNNAVVIPIVTTTSTDPTGAGAISMLDQTPRPWTTP